jgi:hypothetical protein
MKKTPEDILHIGLGIIEGITDDMLLHGLAPTENEVRALVPEDAWDPETRGGIYIVFEDAYYDRLAKFYRRYPEQILAEEAKKLKETRANSRVVSITSYRHFRASSKKLS